MTLASFRENPKRELWLAWGAIACSLVAAAFGFAAWLLWILGR